ncbi:MAG: tRNA (N(6)-L-threonylcarbamoyladenosine(37)-C(2))-methylthiotransferase MtaB [Planctomycetota bacterium]
MKTCAFATFGCKTNQYETQAIREQIIKHGLKEVPKNSTADLYVINTCVVTEEALKKSVKYIRRILASNPESKIVVTGCLVNYNKQALEVIADKVLLLPNSEKQKLANIVFDKPHTSSDLSCPTISGNAGHTRAFLKIQDGCDNFCSYCIVPFVRGAPRSRSLEDIEMELDRLVKAEYKEVVLTGINIGLYGKYDNPKSTLASLIEKIARKKLFARIRLSSIETTELTDELISVMKAYPEICPHLHVPLQSASDKILSKMNRNYTAKTFMEKIENIYQQHGTIAVTTDVIVGFPGENEEDFEKTVQLSEKAGFARMHIFPFSARKGTTASVLIPKCSVEEKQRRCRYLTNIAAKLALSFKEKFVGKRVRVLVETQHAGKLSGYSDCYLVTEFTGSGSLKGQLAEVDVKSVTSQKLIGTLADRKG